MERNKQKRPQGMEENREWDIKKIIIALLILIPILFVGFLYKDLLIAGARIEKSEPRDGPHNVKPTFEPWEEPRSTKPAFTPGSTTIQAEAEKTVESIKTRIESLDVAEVASSSPQVKKLIEDIKSLPDYPSNQARNMCLKICEGI